MAKGAQHCAIMSKDAEPPADVSSVCCRWLRAVTAGTVLHLWASANWAMRRTRVEYAPPGLILSSTATSRMTCTEGIRCWLVPNPSTPRGQRLHL